MREMELLKNLNSSVSYIENHLSDEIDLNEAARLACESADGFSKLFRSLTDMTVKEYIRKRRLTLAAYELQSSNGRVIDIAVKYGWNSADAFCKAFEGQHGITPTNARDESIPINAYPPVSFHITIKGAEKMNLKITEIPEFEVYGVTEKFGGTADERFEKEHIMWSENFSDTPKKLCSGFNGIWYGIWNKGNYTIARAKGDTDFEGLEKLTVPKGKYAVFTTEKGGYAGDELPKLNEQIFTSWLPDSEYVLKDDYLVEVYHLWTNRAERRAKRYYEIWIPIEKR